MITVAKSKPLRVIQCRERILNPTVCFVHTPCSKLDDDRLEPPLGLLYLASRVQQLGYAVHLRDFSSRVERDLDLDVPDGCAIYGFSTYSVNYSLTRRIASLVKRRNPNALFVAGGPHASALPEHVANDGFDVVVRGEGEIAIEQILYAVEKGQDLPHILSGIPPDPLDALPFPSYELVDLSSYTREVDGHRCVSILSSRGCPYRCTFCNSNIMGAGRPIRYRSPENVAAEIRSIKHRYQIRYFRFQDDVFTTNLRRVTEMARYLAFENIVYRCFARINTHTRRMADSLRQGGCVHVSFGVETGNPRLLAKHAMQKGQTPDQIRWALSNAHEAGLRIRIFLIVGFPGETDETIEETLTLVKSCPWDEFSVYPLIAYPGTSLHDHPDQFGITHINRNYSSYLQIGRDYQAGFTIRTKEFDEQKVRQWRDHVLRELLDDGRTWAGSSQGFK